MQSLKKVSVLGVIIGSVVGVGGKTIVLLVIGTFIGILLASGGPANVNEIGYTNPYVFSITVLITSLFSILGGYIAAFIAKHNELLNGALSSFLAMMLAVCSISTEPLYLTMFYLITSPLFALLGGYLRLKQINRGSSTSRRRTVKLSPFIQLTGIVIEIGVIWSLWFGWSLASFVGPGIVLSVGYLILRSFRKDSPKRVDAHQK